MVNKTLEYNIINVLDGQTTKSDTLALDVSNDNANYIVHRALEHQNVLSSWWWSQTLETKRNWTCTSRFK